MRTEVNIIPEITWRFTQANSRIIDLNEVEYKQYSDSANEKISDEFNKIFVNKKYGVSREVLELNQKLKNYEKFYVLDENICLEENFYLNENNNFLSDQHGIFAKENTDSTLIFDYKSSEDVETFKNSVFKIKAEKNSNLKIVIIQRLSNFSKSFLSIVSDIDEGANVHLVHIELGAKESYANYRAILGSEKAHADIKTAYFVNEDRYLDLGYEITHLGRKTTSDMVINGVLKDFAKKRFAGTLDFKKGCTLAQGNEEEFVTLLDPTVKNWAIPLLLAREDDIVGNHAASAGRIDKDMLFYITSRGFDSEAAKRIIIESKLKPIFDLIGNEKISEELLEELRKGIN